MDVCPPAMDVGSSKQPPQENHGQAVAAAGIRILVSQEIDRKASLVIAISLAFGIGVEMVPDILCKMPQTIREIFTSGITTGSCAAIITNMIIRAKKG